MSIKSLRGRKDVADVLFSPMLSLHSNCCIFLHVGVVLISLSCSQLFQYVGTNLPFQWLLPIVCAFLRLFNSRARFWGFLIVYMVCTGNVYSFKFFCVLFKISSFPPARFESIVDSLFHIAHTHNFESFSPKVVPMQTLLKQDQSNKDSRNCLSNELLSLTLS